MPSYQIVTKIFAEKLSNRLFECDIIHNVLGTPENTLMEVEL